MAAKKKSKKVEKKEVITDPIKSQGAYGDAIAYCARMFRSGLSEEAAIDYVKATYKQFSETNIQLIIHKASESIAQEYARDKGSVISLHVKRYNAEIKKLIANTYEGLIDEDNDDGKGDQQARKRKMRIFTLMTALDVMFAKERVLQIHNKETQVRIFNKLNAKVKEVKTKYNLSQLSLEEKIDFLNLVKKAKRDQVETFSIKMMGNKRQEVEDVEAEVIEETPNIEKIKHLPAPEKKVVAPKVTLEDVTRKIQENLAKRAAVEFKKKGGMKGGPHIKETA